MFFKKLTQAKRARPQQPSSAVSCWATSTHVYQICMLHLSETKHVYENGTARIWTSTTRIVLNLKWSSNTARRRNSVIHTESWRKWRWILCVEIVDYEWSGYLSQNVSYSGLMSDVHSSCKAILMSWQEIFQESIIPLPHRQAHNETINVILKVLITSCWLH